MGGSKERTIVGLQVSKLVEKPEKVHKAIMREAYKNVPAGMRPVMKAYQQSLIDSKSMFNDGYLTAMGYNPRENIKYRVVDQIKVLQWARYNIDVGVTSVSECSWSVPSLRLLAIEHLQDTYGVFDFNESSVVIGVSKWFLSGVTLVSTTATNATLYKDATVTAQEYASANGLTVVSIEDAMVAVSGVNYWKVTFSDTVRNLPVEYRTEVCPGVNSVVVQDILEDYNGKVYNWPPTQDCSDVCGWSSKVTVQVYVGDAGDIVVSGKSHDVSRGGGYFSAYAYTRATKDVVDTIVGQVRAEIASIIQDSLDRLTFKYVLNGTTRLKIAEIDQELVSSNTNAKAFPIIPLKEKYAMVNETSKMIAMLNKLGMHSKDFTDSLSDGRLKNAALMFIVDAHDDSKIGTKFVYETISKMIETLVPAQGKIAEYTEYQLDLGYSDVDMKTKLSVEMVTLPGSIGEVGEYTRTTEIRSSVGTVHGIRKQITEEYYTEVMFYGGTKWNVGGYTELSDGSNTIYIPVTDIGLSAMTYEELNYITGLSMSLMTTSVVKVKTKWYQSGFFKFVMIVGLVAVTIATAGASIGATASAITALTGASAATATVIATTALVVTTTIAVASMMGIDVGVLGSVATVIGIAQMGAGMLAQTGSMTTGQTVLTSAKALTSAANMAIEINTKGSIKAMQDRLEATYSKLEESSEELKKLTENVQQGIWMGIQDRTPDMLYAMSSTDIMCNYAILYDYDGMIDGQISSVGI